MLLLLGFFAGCDNRTPPSAPNPANTPGGYLQNAVQAKSRALKTVDATSANKAIELFYVQEGHYPKDLLELVEKSYLPELPDPPAGMKWEYDTNSGIASITKD